MDRFITNDEGPGGFLVVHFLLVPTNLTSRSWFSGSFVLSYSRSMLDNIIKAASGENRFNDIIFDKQIDYGDTDSVLVNVDIAKTYKKQ